MTGTLAIVVFFTGLLFIILIHEAGHYVVARRFGFKVEEYFVGFGPKLWSFRRGEIEYGVKALPLGGYVKIAGMNPYEPVPPEDVPRSYGAKPIWQRALTIFAGPGSHFVVAAILFAIWLFVFGDPRTAPIVVEQVPRQLNGHVGPAYAGGMRPGDVVVGIDGIADPSRGAGLDHPHLDGGRPSGSLDPRRGLPRRPDDHPLPRPRAVERRGRDDREGRGRAGAARSHGRGRDPVDRRGDQARGPVHRRVVQADRPRLRAAGHRPGLHAVVLQRAPDHPGPDERRGHRPAGRRDGSRGGLGHGPVLPRVRHGVHRSAEPAPPARRSTVGIWRCSRWRRSAARRSTCGS